jgi:hypothetical protein
MARPGFLTELHEASRDVRRLLAGDGMHWLVRLISDGEDRSKGTKVIALDTDRIYELMCFFALVGHLDANVALRCVKGAGDTGYRLPYGPANKGSFAFFRFEHDDATYDVCAGTGVPALLGGSTEHPDISLQRMGAPNAPPTPGKLVAIWDAKYHKGNVLSKGDIGQMNMWLDVLDMPRCCAGDILERLFPGPYQVAAVITNAGDAPNYEGLLLKKGFSLVLAYRGPGSSPAPKPTRADQIAHAPVMASV